MTRVNANICTYRACIFEGDVLLYIFQISFVYFTLIKNTIAVYQQCFPSSMVSASIKWAKEQLDDFNALLARQMFSVERGTSVWQECMDIVHEDAATLREVGVDFGDLVARGLESNVHDTSDGEDDGLFQDAHSR